MAAPPGANSLNLGPDFLITHLYAAVGGVGVRSVDHKPRLEEVGLAAGDGALARAQVLLGGPPLHAHRGEAVRRLWFNIKIN